jgi:hypothetical protein
MYVPQLQHWLAVGAVAVLSAIGAIVAAFTDAGAWLTLSLAALSVCAAVGGAQWVLVTKLAVVTDRRFIEVELRPWKGIRTRARKLAAIRDVEVRHGLLKRGAVILVDNEGKRVLTTHGVAQPLKVARLVSSAVEAKANGATRQPHVFVSYRHGRNGSDADTLKVELERRLGPNTVFVDATSLEGGRQWWPGLNDAVLRSTVVVALISPEWLEAQERLTDEGDIARRELLLALDHAIPVLPVLVGSADLYETRLPPELRELTTWQAERLQGGPAREWTYSLLADHIRELSLPNAPRPVGEVTNSTVWSVAADHDHTLWIDREVISLQSDDPEVDTLRRMQLGDIVVVRHERLIDVGQIAGRFETFPGTSRRTCRWLVRDRPIDEHLGTKWRHAGAASCVMTDPDAVAWIKRLVTGDSVSARSTGRGEHAGDAR